MTSHRLDPLLRPTSIAVIGARAQLGTVDRTLLAHAPGRVLSAHGGASSSVSRQPGWIRIDSYVFKGIQAVYWVGARDLPALWQRLVPHSRWLTGC